MFQLGERKANKISFSVITKQNYATVDFDKISVNNYFTKSHSNN